MQVKVFVNIFEEQEPQIFEADNLCDWLIDRYGESPEIGLDLFVGEPDLDRCITAEIASIVNANAPLYSVIERPGGTLTAGQLFYYFAVVVIGLYSASQAGNTQMPQNVNRTQQSPNNGFGDRNNQPRLFQRIEDIYGKVQAIPSNMMQTWDYYDSTGNKFERGYYCVGRGYYAIQAAEVLEATTPFSSIPNSRLSVYPPFVIPNGDVTRAQLNIGGGIAEPVDCRIKYKNVSGLVMRAPNQLGLSGTDEYFFRDHYIVQLTREPDFATVFNPGDMVQVTMSDVDYTPDINNISLTFVASTKTITDTTGSGIFGTLTVGDRIKFTSTSNTGTFTVNSVVDVTSIRHLTVVETVVDAVEVTGLKIIVNYTGTYNITAVQNIMWHVTGIEDTRYRTPFQPGLGEVTDSLPTLTVSATFPYKILGNDANAIPIYCVVSPVGAPTDEWTQWFTVTDRYQTQLLFNVNAINGVYKDAGGGPTTTTVDCEFQVQRLVGGVATGSVFTTPLVTLRSNTITGSTGASLLYSLVTTAGFTGACQVRGRRVSLHDFAFQGSVVDEISWEAMYSVTPQTRTHFGNKTTILSDVKLNQRAITIQNRQLSVEAFRKLPTWNGSTWSAVLNSDGSLASGTLNTTRNPVDIIAAITQDKKIGNRPLSDLDIVQMQGVIDTINAWNPNCSEFNYTFDSDSTSYEDHLAIIANAVFCEAYRQNSKIRLAFDGPQPTSSAIVTHRSKQPGAVDTISRNFFDDSDYDAVQVIYNDPTTLVSESFYIPVSGNFSKAKKIEIPGIRNFTQAWFRGNREYYRIFNQKIAIRTTMTMEARAFTPNLRIDIVDNTRFKIYSGEVLGINLLTKVLTLSDEVVFKSGQNHTIVLGKRNGTQESIPCTATSSANTVLLAYLPSEAVVVLSGVDGVRTIYSFAADDDRSGMAYRVKRINYSEPPYVQLEAVNYAVNDYTADFLAVPNRVDIIGA